MRAIGSVSPPPVMESEVLRRFWYPVARLDALDDGPVARHLLGEEVVVWSSGPGMVAAASNRCPHRDARLSTGWIESCGLVCPYHGWAFDDDGAPTRIPQMAGGTFPAKAALTTFQAQERYGWVWVCLDQDPLLPIPEIDEFGADGWRIIHEPETEWACTAAHLVDNNIDPAHIAFVHRESFGTPSKPEVELPTVEHTDVGLRLGYRVGVEGRPGEHAPTVRTTTNQLHGAFLMLNRIEYPDGLVQLMVKSCTPETATTTRQLQIVLRNDTEQDRPAAEIVGFDQQVWAEDKAVLEHCWTDFHTDLTGNVHLKTDKASIEYRRWLADLVGSDGDGGTTSALTQAS